MPGEKGDPVLDKLVEGIKEGAEIVARVRAEKKEDEDEETNRIAAGKEGLQARLAKHRAAGGVGGNIPQGSDAKT